MGSNEARIPHPLLPPSKIARLRAKLYQFTQKEGESLYDAWERFKEMLRLCPHHGLEKWLIIHTFTMVCHVLLKPLLMQLQVVL
jgi:hypothetical protein